MTNENNLKLEKEELEAEEVNLYASGCGKPIYSCVTDCFDFSCFITCEN